MSQLIGVAPANDNAAGAIFSTCACGAKVVWALDDRWPNDEIGALVNLEPDPAGKGKVVLWYEVTSKGKPRGKQWFRYPDPREEYKGPLWRLHICGEQVGGAT